VIGGARRGQLFLCLLFLKLGRDPLAPMAADKGSKQEAAADMDNSRPEPEAVGRLTHTAAEAQDMSQPVLVEVSLDLPPFVPQTRGGAYICVYQIHSQHMIVLIGRLLLLLGLIPLKSRSFYFQYIKIL
jgi:hypothetical protein